MTNADGAVLAACALWLAPAFAAQFPEPHVCVPGADGRSWECGRGADAPAPRPLPTSGRPQPRATAPLLLTDPDKLPQLRPSGPMVAPGAVERIPAPSSPSASRPVDPRPIAAAAAAPAPAPRAEAGAAPRPDRQSAPTPSATPAPSTARVGSDRSAPTPVPAQGMSGRPATGAYTVQLAGARSPEGFLRHLRALGLDPTQAFMVETERAGSRWWVLLYGRFDSRAAAKAALDPLPEGAWTRALSEFGPGAEWLSIR